MNTRRLLAVARAEAAFQWKRPLFWVAVVLLFATSFMLSTGTMHISTGDVAVGGKKAWITSAFAATQVFTLVWSLFLAFFLAIAGGMAAIRDREIDVAPLLHSSPLTPAEYAFGKYLGVVLPYVVLLVLHVAFTALICNLPSVDAEMRGPFAVSNWTAALLPFGVPLVLFFTGGSFLLGARTGKPILVFFMPLAFLMLCAMFVWNWHPVWLDARLSRLLCLVDPAGVRWLEETWLQVDRGVDFYNHEPMTFDLPFALSRVVLSVLGLLGVACAIPAISAEARGRAKKKAAGSAPQTDDATAASTDRVGNLAMTARAPGFVASVFAIARVEFHELIRSPGLYLFAPLIVLQTVAAAEFSEGWLGMQSLVTPGIFVARSFNTVSLLVSFLALFYVTESLERDLSTRFGNIAFATPVRTSALLAGKCLANSFVGAVVVAVAALTGLVLVAIDGKIPLALAPFGIVYGLLLFPTLICITAFTAMVHSVSGNRFVTYGVCLAAITFTGIAQAAGHMNWVFNWNLWSLARWSDISTFELDRSALVMNRILVLLASALFVQFAVKFHVRRSRDGVRTLWRLRPASLARGSLAFLPLLVPLFGVGIALALDIHRGYAGESARDAQKDYWKQNVRTWLDSKFPRIENVDLKVDLFPAERRMHVEGTYALRGREDEPLQRFCITVGRHFEHVSMKLELDEPGNAGAAHVPPTSITPIEKKLLYAFELPRPLTPADTCRVVFSHDAVFPDGISKNGGNPMEFVLPSGVVLTAFGPQFVPMPGFVESMGVDDDNRAEPKSFPDDYWRTIVPPGIGMDRPYDAHCVVTCPADFSANFVGDLVREKTANGRKTLEWQAHGVRFFNLAAGRWEVSRGDGVAIYYDRRHSVNIASMTKALEAARRYFTEWFAPFPWRELKLSEFPAIASYAQGFPTNITFSENIGFLGDDDEHGSMGFIVTAHESAHQWWGNILTPGDGPGGNVLSEGMAHISTMLLVDQVQGPYFRRKFALGIEDKYARDHVADAERSIAKVDGSKNGDDTIFYDKGGMVGWMTQRFLGRERFFAACRDFIQRFKDGPDFPQIEDYVAVLREHAGDKPAFDAFAKQWYFDIVRPQYKFSEAKKTKRDDGTMLVTAIVTNVGTGTMPIEVAATKGGDKYADDGKVRPEYAEQRVTVTLAAGASATVSIECAFDPESIVVDPDVDVLMLERKSAIFRF